jgi:hypothetical protein
MHSVWFNGGLKRAQANQWSIQGPTLAHPQHQSKVSNEYQPESEVQRSPVFVGNRNVVRQPTRLPHIEHR